MYKSPIEIIQGQLQVQLEGTIMRAVQQQDVIVDKEELIRALQYDRDQYEKGYADAMASIVRCEVCKHFEEVATLYGKDTVCTNQGCMRVAKRPDDFCSRVEFKHFPDGDCK